MLRSWQRVRPCSGLSSVMLAVRVGISLRPGMAFSNRSLTHNSAAFIGCRGGKSPVRQLRQALLRARDAGKTFDIGIPGRDIVIIDRPGAALAVALVGLEIDMAP